MRKEQIAFIVAAVVLALFVFGGDEGSGRKRRTRGRAEIQLPQMQVPTPVHLNAEALVWSRSLDNMYRAPRETEALEPIEIAPPPTPARPHPGLPLVDAVGGDARASLRHALVPDGSVSWNSGQSLVLDDQEPTDPENPDEVAPEDDDPFEGLSPTNLTPAERLRLKTIERLALEKLQEMRDQAEAERRSGLDRVIYDSAARGRRGFGRIEPENPEDDVFAIKLRIDELQRDRQMSEAEKRRELDKLKFVFREDRGPNKTPGRAVLSGQNIVAIEFADTPLNRFELETRRAKDDVDAQLRLAREVYDAGEIDAAAAHLEKQHARGHGTASSYALLSDAHRRRLAYDKELAVLEAALEKFPSDLGLQARMGQLCLRINLPAKAETAFAAVIEQEANQGLARLGMGRIALAAGRLDEAIRNFEQARDSRDVDDGQRTEALLGAGRACLAKGDVTRAGRFFDTILETDPTHADAVVGKASVQLATSGAADALASVQAARAVAENAVHGALAYTEAICHLRLGAWSDAATLLALVPEFDPFLTARARTAQSYLLEKQGSFEAALAEAESALVADPDDIRATQQKARCRLLVGDLDGARETYLEVLALEPRNTDVLVALGDAAFAQGEVDNASRYFARAASIDTDYPALFARRFIAAIRRGDDQEAQSFISKITARMERDSNLQAGLAYHDYVMKADAQETLQRFRQILAREAASPELKSFVEGTRDAIEDNLAKQRWRDDFERTGIKLMRDWEKDVGAGINVALAQGRLAFKGTQKRSMDPTVAFQRRSGRFFHSFEADLDMKPGPGIYQGMGFLFFNRGTLSEPYDGAQRRDQQIAYYGMQIALTPERRLQYRTLDKGKATEWLDLPVTYEGGPIRLGFERIENRQNGPKRDFVHLLVNRRRAAEIEVPGFSRMRRMIELQVFCQADNGRQIENFSADNVEIVTRKP